MKTACPRCSNVSGLPPQDGRCRCGNCGHRWEVPKEAQVVLGPDSTIADLVRALRQRSASISIEPAPVDGACVVSVSARGIVLTLGGEAGDVAAVLSAIDRHDVMRLAIGAGK